jgi:penicillin-binding protein 2
MRGQGFTPHVLRATENSITGEMTTVTPQPLEPITLKDNRNWPQVIQAMVDTAHTAGGTAYSIGRNAPYLIAAKTGTAQVASLAQDEDKAPSLEDTPEHLRDHALFIAFAPADEPRIAIAVIAEHAGHGGAISAPIARQVMDMYLLGEVRHRFVPFVPPPRVPASRPTRPAEVTLRP